MRVEVGKSYRAEDGKVYGPMVPWACGSFCEANNKSRYAWLADGASVNPSSGRNLIEEVKENAMNDEEYQIPVLVKACVDTAIYEAAVRELAGKVVLCKPTAGPGGSYQGPKGSNPYQNGAGWGWADHEIIAYPTQAQVEAERAKLRPKADPLPGPVRQALDEAGLGCRTDGVRKLVEAIYANPPRAVEG